MAITKGDGPNRGEGFTTTKALPKPKPRPEFAPARTSAAAPRVDPRDPIARGGGVTYGDTPQNMLARQKQSEQAANLVRAMTDRARLDSLRTIREAADRKETGSALTSRQWASLSPLQQAAVQSNADLSAAIQRDKDSQGKNHANAVQIRSYRDRVDELFGEDGSVGVHGLDYAPNTVAFLNERGITKDDLAGKTLDDIVNGDTLILSETVGDLGRPKPKADALHAPAPKQGLEAVRADQLAFAERLAAGQMQYQEKIGATLKKGEALLSNISSVRTNQTAGDTYGAMQDKGQKLDKVKPATLQQLDLYMEALARSDSPIDKALEAINLDLNQRGVEPDERDQVYQALLERAGQGATGQGKWFDGVDFPMRSPVEVAQALGAPTLKRAATSGGQ